ncbi:unnamed protein product, partial [Oncorhynchus mykiss]
PSLFLSFSPGSQALSPEERPSSGGDRKKWEAGSPSILSVAQQTLEDTCIRTAEQTVGEVIRMDVLQDDAPRKAWGRSPDSQVLRVLQEAELQPLTQLLGNVNICEEKLTGESLIYPPTHTYHYQPHSVQTQRLSANDSDWFPFRQLESDG